VCIGPLAAAAIAAARNSSSSVVTMFSISDDKRASCSTMPLISTS